MMRLIKKANLELQSLTGELEHAEIARLTEEDGRPLTRPRLFFSYLDYSECPSGGKIWGCTPEIPTNFALSDLPRFLAEARGKTAQAKAEWLQGQESGKDAPR